jgi:DNA polymerase I-like protein with 3'-5' exonuclease and polymerase domains
LAQCWIRGLKGVFQAHDEVVITTADKDFVKLGMEEAIEAVNTKLQLNIPLSIDVKFGDSYAAIH